MPATRLAAPSTTSSTPSGAATDSLSDPLADRLGPPPRPHRTGHRNPTWTDIDKAVGAAIYSTIDDFRRNQSRDADMTWDDKLALTLKSCGEAGMGKTGMNQVGSLFFERGKSSSWDEPYRFRYDGGRAIVDFRHVNPHDNSDAVQSLQLTPPAPFTGLDTWQRGANVDAFQEGRTIPRQGTWLDGPKDELRARLARWQVKYPAHTVSDMIERMMNDFMTWGSAVVRADLTTTVALTPQQRVVSAMNALMGTAFSAIELPARTRPQVQDEGVIQKVFADDLGWDVDIDADNYPTGITIRP